MSIQNSLASFRLRSALLSLALCGLMACSKSKDADVGPAGMSWQVNGSSTTAKTTNVQTSGNLITIHGDASPGSIDHILAILMPKSTGTFTLDGSSAADVIYEKDGLDYDVVSGSVVVSSYSSTNITGTFSFVGEDGSSRCTVSNGRFNITY